MEYLEKYLFALRQLCASMNDRRSGTNIQYAMEDIGMAAFSVFFMQHPSFLAFQRATYENVGRDNTQTLFGMKKIPTDNHIRKMLDGVSPAHFDSIFFDIIDDLNNIKVPIVNNVLNGHTLISIDGTEYFSSKKISCQSCSKRKRSDGTVESFHSFFGATIVTPGDNKVFSLPPEFMQPQIEDKKQDSELKAAKRWFERFAPSCEKYKPIYLGDDLYAKQDFCNMLLQNNSNFIFTCKDSSHKTLTEFRKGLTPSTHKETKGIGTKKREFHYSWLTNLPIRDGPSALLVNYFDVRIIDPKGKEAYRSSFITNLTPNASNISELVSCARARWKIENETFNVLKNNGYHLEHNFGHGQTTLAAMLVIFNLLAFTIHNACEAVEALWMEARSVRGTRKRFFIHLWTITSYHIFPTWSSLLTTISTGRAPPS